MSEDTLDGVMRRIEGADPSSPVAVFTVRSELKLNVVPANTYVTQQLIERDDPTLVGVFDGSMPQEPIRVQLHRSLLQFRRKTH
ncbi:hypothetical protein HBA55_29560 [Pseudomaricurvus alkylphenolicus]|uniref:hypothetical protein n=1 Tax=Pseudomaricurvus alkylphenolicus TaxID=1306991 RepID=UPI001422B50B|nr:hypothetical protein [Pseudomaricurvus alkylphenolicus]NIB43786.1 hypothetical protein [Pseudomaricurvus alkylphenolicus]